MLGETSNFITRNALHSIDSGNHTCSVTDYTGRTGNATVQVVLTGKRLQSEANSQTVSLPVCWHGMTDTSQVHVVIQHECISLGVALYLEGTGLVQNNSIIATTTTGRIGELQCISASRSADVGRLIAPNGNDITNNTSIVTVGSITDPGFISLELQNSISFIRSNQGVYTCIIPDENGTQQYLHTGIYYGGFNSM